MTPRTIEQLFQQFRDDGTPAALAEVFDRTAPELLRVACHVARDLASAEDLVQSTFLTAVESAARFDERRRLLPWLLGILANHARAARRAESRGATGASCAPELRVLPRLEPSPLPGVESRELASLAQRELDALSEPYREVAILALRHHLEPREIAAALGRSPGAVRVQLHRALESLRRSLPGRAALPALFAFPSGASFVATCGRGLAPIRSIVLKSATKAAAAAALVTVGSLVVTKKLVAASVLAAAAATVVWRAWQPPSGSASSSHSTIGVASSDAGATLNSTTVSNGSIDVAPARLEAERSSLVDEATLPATTVKLEGDVFDGTTREPLERANVEFFAPTKMSLQEARTRFAQSLDSELEWESYDGSIQFHGAWPKLVLPIPAGAWRGAELVELCGAPSAGETPLWRTHSDAHGRFSSAAPRATGVLVVSHDGFERQVFPIASAGTTISIALFPPKEFVGSVVDESNRPWERSIRLELGASTRSYDPKDALHTLTWPAQCGPWFVDTDDTGRFRVQAGAESLSAWSATIGVEVVRSKTLNQDGTLVVTVRKSVMLSIVDAKTHTPIEDFSLIATSARSGSPTYCGRFHAAQGQVKLDSTPASVQTIATAVYSRREPLHVDVWSDDHLPKRFELPASSERVDTTVELEPGAPPELAGRLLRHGEPIASAVVSLHAVYWIAWRDQRSQIPRFDECVTAADGSFHLHGPPGNFVLAGTLDGRRFLRKVELPAAGATTFDVTSGGRIEVVVRDPKGAPKKDAKVYVDGADRQEHLDFTDESGVVRFDSLPAGEYRVSLNGTRETHVAIAQDEKTVHVDEGATASVALLGPPTGPVALRIRATGVTDYTGWKAGDGTYSAVDLVELGADGLLDADASTMAYVTVRSPKGFEWRLKVTPDVLAKRILEVRVSDVGYRGHVVDRDTGAPLADVEVYATTKNGNDSWTCRTDAEGCFDLANLETGEYTLEVRDVSERGGDRFHARNVSPHAWFDVAQPPAPTGREVTLRVPMVKLDGSICGVGRRVFSGRVLRKSDRAPIGNASFSMLAQFRDDDGAWRVGIDGSWARTGTDGHYQLAVPRAPTYTWWFAQERGELDRKVTNGTWSDDGGAADVQERDLLVE